MFDKQRMVRVDSFAVEVIPRLTDKERAYNPSGAGATFVRFRRSSDNNIIHQFVSFQ